MNLNVDEYLSEQDKRMLARNAFREAIAEWSSNNAERIITNYVYHWIDEKVDEILGEDHKKFIERKVSETLNKVDFSYHIFRTPNAWERSENEGQKVLREAIHDNHNLVKEKVETTLKDMNSNDLTEHLEEVIKSIIEEKVRK